MFNNDFVASVKCGRKVLREQSGAVSIPFGSEYSLLLKNMGATRAAVSVSIDGTSATGGSRLILDPNEECDLEGFMAGSLVTHKFKFIEKTSEISEHRGDKAADGMLRVEFQFEKKPAVINTVHTHHVHHDIYRPGWGWGYWNGPVWYSGRDGNYTIQHLNSTVRRGARGDYGGPGGSAMGGGAAGGAGGGRSDIYMGDGGGAPAGAVPCSANYSADLGGSVMDFCDSDDAAPTKRIEKKSLRPRGAAASDELKDGITVKGSSSNQSFRTGYLGMMEEAKHVINLSLKGFYSEAKRPLVEVPVTVTNLPDYNGVPMRLVKIGDRENIASAADVEAVIAEMKSCSEADYAKKE